MWNVFVPGWSDGVGAMGLTEAPSPAHIPKPIALASNSVLHMNGYPHLRSFGNGFVCSLQCIL